jgi:butyrate kinase
VTLPDGEQIAFRDVSGAQIDDGNFSTNLVITHGEKKKSKVNLRHLKEQAEPFKATFGQYWNRDQVARQSASASQAA